MILRLTLLAALISTSALASPETDRWDKHKAAVTITRDDFGIPHIKGKTDADAVFGMIYAQAEDDFNRVEVNFINALGRMAEVEGINSIYNDFRMKFSLHNIIIILPNKYVLSNRQNVMEDVFTIEGVNLVIYL